MGKNLLNGVALAIGLSLLLFLSAPCGATESVYTIIQYISAQEWTPPTVIWSTDSPIDGLSYSRCYLYFRVIADEVLDSCVLQVDSTNYSMTVLNTNCYLTLDLSDGSYLFRAYAYDAFDNLNATEQRNATIVCSTPSGTAGSYSDRPEPPTSRAGPNYERTREMDNLILIAVAITAVLAIIIVVLLVRRKRRMKRRAAPSAPTIQETY
jgi:hypothetical protein